MTSKKTGISELWLCDVFFTVYVSPLPFPAATVLNVSNHILSAAPLAGHFFFFF